MYAFPERAEKHDTREIKALTKTETSKYKRRWFVSRGWRGWNGDGKRRRNQLFVTVSGLSRSIICRKVLLTALIFRPFLLFSCFFLSIPSTRSHAPFFSISTSVHGTKHVCSLLLLQSLIVLVYFGVKHPDVTPSYLAEIQERETLWISKRTFPLPRTLVESAVCWNNDHTNYEWVNHNLLLTKFRKLWLDRSIILFKVYNYLPCLKRSSRILIICKKFYFIQVYCSWKL